MRYLSNALCKGLLMVGLVSAMLGIGPAKAQDKTVIGGYQLVIGPYLVAISNGEFEKATGYKIEWRQFNSAADTTAALVSGDVKFGLLGSTGIAAAISRGVDLNLFWVLDDIGRSEALVVRNGSGINSPQDLKGKKIAVPFVSTSHFHLLAALDKIWHIAPDQVQILNMKPPQIAAAWQRGDIDGAYVWPPALTEIQKNGKTLITSLEVGQQSVPTFDGMVVNGAWAKENPDFMQGFTSVLAKTYADYNKNKDKWTADSPQVQQIVKMIGGKPEDIAEAIELLSFPNASEQASSTWLGGGKESKAAQALANNAEFLKNQGQIDQTPGVDVYDKHVVEDYAKKAAEAK